MKCSTDECEREAICRGVCNVCYQKNRRAGTPTAKVQRARLPRLSYSADGEIDMRGQASPSYAYRDLLSPEVRARLEERENNAQKKEPKGPIRQ